MSPVSSHSKDINDNESDAGSVRSVCVSEACTCGKHHCPHHETVHYNPKMGSLYKTDFPERPYCAEKSTKPVNTRVPFAVGDTGMYSSSNQDEFRKPGKNAYRPSMVGSKEKQVYSPKGEFYGSSTNHTDFSPPPKGAKAPSAAKPPKGNINMRGGEINPTTTNRADFQKWDVDRRTLGASNDAEDGTPRVTPANWPPSEYNSNYIGTLAEVPKSYKPGQRKGQSGTGRYSTMYKDEFTDHGNGKVESTKPLTSGIEHVPYNPKMGSLYKTDFPERPYCAEKSTKPVNTRVPFAVGDTGMYSSSNQDEFRKPGKNAYRPSMVGSKEKQVYSPKGEFYGSSTNHTDFSPPPKGAKAPSAAKPPKGNINMRGGEINPTTTNRADFQKWDVDRRTLGASNDAEDGTPRVTPANWPPSEYNSNYIGTLAEVPKSYKPGQRKGQSGTGRYSTMYKEEFVRHPLSSRECPVSALPNRASSSDGHTRYHHQEVEAASPRKSTARK